MLRLGFDTVACRSDGYYYTILLDAGMKIARTGEGEVKTTSVSTILLDVREAVLP